jgi:hypothetical protein
VNNGNLALWVKWILANSLGELLGLGATFAIGFGLFSGLADSPNPIAVLLSAVLMTASGVLEGALVGFVQWLVLRVAIPGILRRAWVLATIIGALIAWFFGSIPMTVASLSQSSAPIPASEPPQALVLLLTAGMGLVAGFILSVVQWQVLRKHVEKAWLWLPANALAWAVGMPLIFAAVDLAQQVATTLARVMVMAAGIALAGAIVGAIHGIALLYFQRSRFKLEQVVITLTKKSKPSQET